MQFNSFNFSVLCIAGFAFEVIAFICKCAWCLIIRTFNSNSFVFPCGNNSESYSGMCIYYICYFFVN